MESIFTFLCAECDLFSRRPASASSSVVSPSLLTFMQRYGCGGSDANTDGRTPTVEETLIDMKTVYDACFPSVDVLNGQRGNVILLGPSMGSIVGQCFIAAYPGLCSGFMNVDGVAHPFFKRRFLFQTIFGNVYKVESLMARIGVFRPMLAMAKSKLAAFASDTFPVSFLTAQLNDPKFWINVAFEMKLMMDLCQCVVPSCFSLPFSHQLSHTVASRFRPNPSYYRYASNAWGSLSMAATLDSVTRESLLSAMPARVGREDADSGDFIRDERACS